MRLWLTLGLLTSSTLAFAGQAGGRQFAITGIRLRLGERVVGVDLSLQAGSSVACPISRRVGYSPSTTTRPGKPLLRQMQRSERLRSTRRQFKNCGFSSTGLNSET